MAKETDLSSLESSVKSTIQEYSNTSLPNDCSKLQAIQVLTKEIGLISGEKKRIFDEEMQKERFELDKDHKYWNEKFEEKKFEGEQALAKERLALEAKKLDETLKQEELKIQIETTRLEIEKTNLELNKQNAKEDRKYRYISLALTVSIPAITTLISLLVYRKLAYNNLKLIYVDEGRPTTNFNDAVKSIKNLTK